MAAVNRNELKQLISDAFGSVPHPGPQNISNEHHCEECKEVVDGFADLTWQAIPIRTIDANYDKLPLFSPAAYHHFLPAFLQRSLDEPEGPTREFTFYSLTTKPDDWLKERTRLFTAAQIRCILLYLEFEQERFEELQNWLETDKVMTKRLAYWKGLLEKNIS